jgi:hypothetical protein
VARSDWTVVGINLLEKNLSSGRLQIQPFELLAAMNQTVNDLVAFQWDVCFNETPYTTFCMIDYLLKKTQIDYKSYLVQPRILKGKVESILGSGNDLENLIALPGRCTSFALNVVRRLEMLTGNRKDYDFQYYDFGHHRAAWCKQTKRLIDSSSVFGAPHLHEGNWLSADCQRQWKAAEEDISKLKTVKQEVRLL